MHVSSTNFGSILQLFVHHSQVHVQNLLIFSLQLAAKPLPHSCLWQCRVTSLRQRVVAVAAANKHTAILTDAGAIFSWGSNDQGQLGYGTSDSASNAVPRQVEAMKVKIFDCTFHVIRVDLLYVVQKRLCAIIVWYGPSSRTASLHIL